MKTALGSSTSTTVLDLAVGSGSSYPEVAVETDGLIYLLATTQDSGRELWRSDGTADGTFLLKDIYPGNTTAPNCSYPDDFQILGDVVVFRATDPTHGRELWVSDGTAAGTQLLQDITSGSESSSVDMKGVYNGLLYFIVGDAASGWQLWRTDGTSAGTFQLSSIYSGVDWSSSTDVALVGGRLVFLASDSTHGKELWTTDGSVAGTELLADIKSGSSTSLPEIILATDDLIYFKAYRTNSSIKGLWCTDGTPAGTNALPDAVTGLHPYDMEMGPAINGIQFFAATDTSHGRELWRTDGTPAGTFMIYDLYQGSGWSSPKELVAVGSNLFFTATDGKKGRELCFSNGQRNNLVFANINPSSTGPEPEILEVLGDVVLFETYCSDYPSDKVLWRSDGTANGTYLLPDTYTDRPCEPGDEACLLPTGVWVFVADADTWGRELWRTDGTSAGTYILKDIRSGASWSSPSDLCLVGDHVVFYADDGTHGRELWSTDGTRANTELLADANNTSADGSYTVLSPTSDHIYPYFFEVTHPTTGHPVLGVTDGTSGGTSLLTDTNTGQLANNPVFLLSSGALHYFSARNDTYGSELWRTDGTPEGTMMLADAAPGSSWGSPEGLVSMGEMVFFTATSSATGREPWITDGTKQGTRMLADIRSGTGSSFPADAVYSEASGLLYFRANNGNGTALWETDGSSAGTQLSTKAPSRSVRSTSDDVAYLGETGQEVFLRGYTSETGYELWCLDLPGPPDPGSASTPLPRPCINMGVGDASFSGTVAMGDDAAAAGQFVLLVPPAKGILSLDSGTGAYTYTPPDGEEFSGSFSYKVVSGGNQTLPRTVPIVVGAQSVSVEVNPGWNLLSVPFDLELAPEMVFVKDGDTLFEGVPWLWSPANNAYNELESRFQGLAGFWLLSQVTQKTVVTVYGLADGSRNLADSRVNGWGLVGVASDTAASDIPRIRLPVWGYGDTKYHETTTLVPGKGYWIETVPLPTQ